MRTNQLLIVTLALVASAWLTGCSGYSPAYWEREAIDVPRSDRAYLAGDGALLLGINVERRLQPEAGGWHWIRVEPAFVQGLFAESVDRRGVDWSATLHDYTWADWAGDDANAQIIPPLHEPGLAGPDPPALFGEDPTRVGLLWNPRAGGFHFTPIGQPGKITKTRLCITPRHGVYQSERGRRRMRVETAVTYPFKLALAAVTTPAWIVPGGYMAWHYAVHDLFHPEWP